MADRDEIIHLLTAARAEHSVSRTRELIKTAVDLCGKWETSGGGIESALLRAEALAELAVEEETPQARAYTWGKSLSVLQKQWNSSPEPEIAERYALLAVDCTQDVLSSLESRQRQKYLGSARKNLDEGIAKAISSQMRASLLARKSSVLRQQCIFELTPEAQVRLAEESLRCSTRAVEECNEAGTFLELGLAEWAMARHSRTDEESVSRLRRAEECFRDSRVCAFELAELNLARFYRMTYRPLEACEAFPRSIAVTRNMRRLLRDCYVYAEAAIQLWYRDYPQDLVDIHLYEARNLLETAIADGYRNARLLVALAFIRAVLENPEAGETALRDICPDQQHISWSEVLTLIAKKEEQPDLLSEGLALGISDSRVWSSLGTFALVFLNELSLAEVLYRQAVRLNRRNPIALTNLARLLVRKGSKDCLQEARRVLQQAQSFSDRRFTWWRAVLAELEEAVQQGSLDKPPAHQLDFVPHRVAQYQTLKQIKSRFQLIEKLSDSQQRGYELERLIFDLAELTFGTAAPSYRFERTGGESQIDVYFEHRGGKYRVECKWREKSSDHNDIVEFADKLDVVGVSGLLISMSGFTPSAIGRAQELRGRKAILLMDGDEAAAVLKGRLTFDELMTRKRMHFDQRSEPYYPVIAAAEVV